MKAWNLTLERRTVTYSKCKQPLNSLEKPNQKDGSLWERLLQIACSIWYVWFKQLQFLEVATTHTKWFRHHTVHKYKIVSWTKAVLLGKPGRQIKRSWQESHRSVWGSYPDSGLPYHKEIVGQIRDGTSLIRTLSESCFFCRHQSWGGHCGLPSVCFTLSQVQSKLGFHTGFLTS